MTAKRLKALLALLASLMLLTGTASAMRISNNITAINTHRFYNVNNNKDSKSTGKDDSSYQLNRPGENVTKASNWQKFLDGIGNKRMPAGNKDGTSLVQTAEGALKEVQSMLQRMVELAMQAANSAISDNGMDRTALSKELDSIVAEIDLLATSSSGYSKLFGYGLGQHNLLIGFGYGEGNVMGLLLSRTGGKPLFLQLATNGSNIISTSSNPESIMVGPGGEIAAVAEGISFISIYDGSGSYMGGWELSSDGENVEVLSSPQLQITLDGVPVKSVNLTVNDEVQLGLVIAESTAAALLESAELRSRPNPPEGSMSPSVENVRIKAVNMLLEMSNFHQHNFLSQAAEHLLAQESPLPSDVLALLQ